MEHALGPDGGVHSALNVPDVRKLRGHVRSVEPRVKHHNWDVLSLELLSQQHSTDVARSPAHVMPVVPALVGVLGGAPLSGARLGGDDDHLPSRGHLPVVVQARGNPQWAQGADIDLLQLLVKIHRRHGLMGLHEVPRIVDDDVNGLLQPLGHALHGGGVRDVHPGDDLNLPGVLLPEGGQLVGGLPPHHDDTGPVSQQLLHCGEAQAPVSSGDQYPCVLQEPPVIHTIDIEIPLVLLLLGPGVPGHLVRHAVHPVGHGAEGGGSRGGSEARCCQKGHSAQHR
mmetsp:Transcript_53532/g.117492  ORF Transcript_53532/g.117492 Transcript_53532/m.117492 type:complete len:283 (+) Transcript_53532:290-1138(+)